MDNLLKWVGVGVLGVFSAGFLFWCVSSTNPETPAGYVGYQTQGAIFGQAKYYGTFRGPGSPGRTWMLKSFPVSITPYTYTEEFVGENSVLSKDNDDDERR